MNQADRELTFGRPDCAAEGGPARSPQRGPHHAPLSSARAGGWGFASVCTRPRHWLAALPVLFALAACGDDSPSATDASIDAAITSDASADVGADASSDAAAEVAKVVADASEDTAVADAAAEVAPDASVADAAPDLPAAPLPYPRPDYQHLSETGYFSDPTTLTEAADLQTFEPSHVLWSDGAEKRRFIRLPPGTRIDTSDMDHWQFPVGTKLWKEFSLNGVRLETRLVERYGTGPDDVWFGAFVWTADQKDAVFAVDGANDINGTAHDAPAAKQCSLCHRGDAGRVLGFSALQLSHDSPAGLTLARLRDAGLLTNPPAPGVSYAAPGDATTAAVLGYFHANCGHCHNPNGAAWPDTDMVMRLGVNEHDPTTTAIWKSLVGKPLLYWRHPPYTTRVVPGDPTMSAVVARMGLRGSRDQMPPLATELTDPAGLDLVTRWVASLPP